MIQRIINFLWRSSLYNDYKKPTFIRKLNFFLNNNFFTNQNRKYQSYSIGDYSYGKPEVLFDDSQATLHIGKYCSIGQGTKIFLGGNHRYDRVSSYPFHQVEDKDGYQTTAIKGNGNVTIGNDVRIGMNVTIMSGITIGDGAVLGYGSLITKDVEPYSIVGGSPAKVIKKRFSEEQITKLLALQWREKDHTLIMGRIALLLSDALEDFIHSFPLSNAKA